MNATAVTEETTAIEKAFNWASNKSGKYSHITVPVASVIFDAAYFRAYPMLIVTSLAIKTLTFGFAIALKDRDITIEDCESGDELYTKLWGAITTFSGIGFGVSAIHGVRDCIDRDSAITFNCVPMATSMCVGFFSNIVVAGYLKIKTNQKIRELEALKNNQPLGSRKQRKLKAKIYRA